MGERVERAHRAAARGLSSGVSVASICSRIGSNRGGRTRLSPRCSEVLVGREPGPQRGDLEQHPARLAEVDRAEPEAVDHLGRSRAAPNRSLAPLHVVVHLRRPGHVVDRSAAGPAGLGRRLVVGVQAAAALAARLPALARRLEAKRVLEQAAARVGLRRVGAHAVEALQRQLLGHLRMVGDQRRVGDGRDHQLVAEPLGVGEPQPPSPRSTATPSAVEPLGPEPNRLLGGHAPGDPVDHAGPRPAGGGAGVLEEGQIGARASKLVRVEEVVDGRVVLVDRLLDQAQAQDARVEVEVASARRR